eukprot:CAMPEP_0179129130 /NCGR_PEP_ID=MMETSP0796-20121207/61255_1 /TAXON_ID=73915 /ORGANISM="Pyrodinium bahamense, Strain pbaha01" /LENGTH=41 /DNA_ID= /DNA_START= /DNA_END= /DNA_ORIENTATION=
MKECMTSHEVLMPVVAPSSLMPNFATVPVAWLVKVLRPRKV